MAYRAGLIGSLGIAVLSLGAAAPAKDRAASPPNAPARAVRSFYAFHFAHNRDFTVRSVQVRRRFFTTELYGLLLKELRRQAAEKKAHPDEAPDFEGDPLTDSQQYPSSFQIGKAEVTGDNAMVTVTLIWSARTSRGADKRDIVVEVIRSSAGWSINDIINNQGSRLRDELKKEH